MQTYKQDFLNYLITAFGCYLVIAIGLSFVQPVQDYNILIWQILLITGSIIFISLGWRLTYQSIFLLIFFFQLFFSFFLYLDFKYIVGNPLGYNAIDSLAYSELAQETCNLSFENSISVLENHLDSFSDFGFPIFLRYVYRIARGAELGHILLIFCNCLFQTATCHLTGKMAYKVCSDFDSSKITVLLWGINPCSIYLNASGLKEPLFAFLCIGIMYGIYQSHDSRSITRHIKLLILIGFSWLFRNYMTLFFLFIYIGYCIFPFLYRKFFSSICVLSFTLCIGLTSVLVAYFPEIYYAMLQSEEVLPSGIGRYAYYMLAFLAPIPKFFNVTTPQMLLVVGYSILKFSFSVFAIIGSWYWIKNKSIQYFPLINIFLFTVIMLIISAHYIDYRYAYPIMPCFFILMIEGLKYRKKLIPYMYLIISLVIVVMFNLKLY